LLLEFNSRKTARSNYKMTVLDAGYRLTSLAAMRNRRLELHLLLQTTGQFIPASRGSPPS
jgi:hypothetical protein